LRGEGKTTQALESVQKKREREINVVNSTLTNASYGRRRHDVVQEGGFEQKMEGGVFFRPFDNVGLSFLRRQGVDFVKRNGKYVVIFVDVVCL
jgi:hypothetical protein